jgi:hypothetical protein
MTTWIPKFVPDTLERHRLRPIGDKLQKKTFRHNCLHGAEFFWRIYEYLS